MWRSARRTSESRQRRMTARLEVLERRTLLSGIFPGGRHAIHIGRTAAADTARVWIDTRKTPSRGEGLVIASSTRDTIFGGTGIVRIGAVVGNNPLYGLFAAIGTLHAIAAVVA